LILTKEKGYYTYEEVEYTYDKNNNLITEFSTMSECTTDYVFDKYNKVSESSSVDKIRVYIREKYNYQYY
jgi:hypothetical protein